MTKRTSWCAAHNNTPDAFVDAFEAASLYESLSRLQTRLDGVYWEEKQVHSCTCRTSCLSGTRKCRKCSCGCFELKKGLGCAR